MPTGLTETNPVSPGQHMGFCLIVRHLKPRSRRQTSVHCVTLNELATPLNSHYLISIRVLDSHEQINSRRNPRQQIYFLLLSLSNSSTNQLSSPIFFYHLCVTVARVQSLLFTPLCVVCQSLQFTIIIN